jgi:hypothetical protein
MALLCVNAQIAESPLQFTLSHRMIQDIIGSAKSGILQVYDNLKIPSTKVEAEEGEFLFLEDIKLHSKNEGTNQIPYNLILDYSFDQDKN